MSPSLLTKRRIGSSAVAVFLLAFGLNYVWEHLHARLYVHYQGGPITEMVLLRAALIDALFIVGVYLLVYTVPFLAKHRWYWTILLGLLAAVFLERYALATGRWAYADAMPLIPLLKTGLTPTIQLALTAVLAFRLADWKRQ